MEALAKQLRIACYQLNQYLEQTHLLLSELFFASLKTVLACSFALSFFVILMLSKQITITGLARYDFILILALLVQCLLLVTKQENLQELKVVVCFHIIGLLLELYKSNPTIGSWAYPEFAYLKVWGVPLYSGFMYAAVASFMLQFWRRTALSLVNYRYPKLTMLLALLVYLNFFSHHFIGDFRWWLMAGLCVVLWQTTIQFTFYKVVYQLPVILCFVILGGLIWLAENIVTFYGAWQYPNQQAAWQLVHWGKISSWGLLVVVTFVIISFFKANPLASENKKHSA